MSVVISDAFALAPGDVPLNTPIFGWQTIVPDHATIEATTAADDYPVSNLTNPSTALRWTAAPGSPPTDEYLTIAVDPAYSDPVDYLAIAVHNLGTGQNTVSVEASDGASPETWDELVAESIPANDDPIIFRWEPASYAGIRLRIQPSPLASPTTPFVAVLYVGKLLVMPRGLSGDSHTPITLARQKRHLNNRGETGNFLGRYLLSQTRTTSYPFQFLDEAWYRATMDPFIDAVSDETPFFAAWKPQEFPADVGYCWLTGDAEPQWHRPTGTMGVTIQVAGVAV